MQNQGLKQHGRAIDGAAKAPVVLYLVRRS